MQQDSVSKSHVLAAFDTTALAVMVMRSLGATTHTPIRFVAHTELEHASMRRLMALVDKEQAGTGENDFKLDVTIERLSPRSTVW